MAQHTQFYSLSSFVNRLFVGLPEFCCMGRREKSSCGSLIPTFENLVIAQYFRFFYDFCMGFILLNRTVI